MGLKKFQDPQVGENIREVRESLGLTQEAFGAKFLYSQNAVDQWEKGRVPHAMIIREIANVAKTSTDAILGLQASAGKCYGTQLLSDLRELVEKYDEAGSPSSAQELDRTGNVLASMVKHGSAAQKHRRGTDSNAADTYAQRERRSEKGTVKPAKKGRDEGSQD